MSATMECCETTSDRAREMVQDHPKETMVAAFVTGAVIGLAIGATLATSLYEPKSASRGMGDRMSDEMAKLGRQMSNLADSLVPDALSKVFSR
ncbi:hypothetical protein [Aeoliella sp. SH292]|uniref:hypothetical protein n=1 Tax=Aeoliella sp. SH292 TaxID=3454464 RepID=UPI003F94ADD9